MPPEKSAPREALEAQDQSIKARKWQLYEEKTRVDTGTVKPFSVYLKDTPGAPLSPVARATLWAVGVVVVLLFVAAILMGGPRPKPRRAALDGSRAEIFVRVNV